MAYFNSLRYSSVVLKKIAVLAAFFILSISSSQTAQALEIDVSGGVISIYLSSVLGESDSSEQHTERAKDSQREHILSRQKQSIRVEKSGERTEIELRPTSRRPQGEEQVLRNKPEHIEQLETDCLQMEFDPEVDRGQRDEIRPEHKANIDSAREERAQRKESDDQVRLKTKDAQGAHRLELESRQVKADIPNGIQFELNADTNEVTLITPSGEQKTLNHLPDQAIERMKAAGIFSDTDVLDEAEVSVNSDTQEIEYRQKVRVTRRLLGFFKREVDSEVVLNDKTGEVREEQQATGFAKFLNSISF